MFEARVQNTEVILSTQDQGNCDKIRITDDHRTSQKQDYVNTMSAMLNFFAFLCCAANLARICCRLETWQMDFRESAIPTLLMVSSRPHSVKIEPIPSNSISEPATVKPFAVLLDWVLLRFVLQKRSPCHQVSAGKHLRVALC